MATTVEEWRESQPAWADRDDAPCRDADGGHDEWARDAAGPNDQHVADRSDRGDMPFDDAHLSGGNADTTVSANDQPPCQARRLLSCMRHYHANREALFDWIDPSWLMPEGAANTSMHWLLAWPEALQRSRSALRERACAVEQWLGASGFPPPGIDRFTTSVSRIAALHLDDALRALRLRALHFRRAELRYWVDRESRVTLGQWLGGDTSTTVRWLLQQAHAPAVAPLMREHGMPPLDEINDVALAWEGFALFAAGGFCERFEPMALLRFMWSRDVPTLPWVHAYAVDNPNAHRHDGFRVIDQLQPFFGEQTWLFG
ncbi:type III secretion protein HrpB4 [Robbsia andropogonis]|uniref:type III secretion protein HrpB4 n=1 Tax=Robbsia andropogonis TaxID=28092 RepID=UPI003D25B1D9